MRSLAIGWETGGHSLGRGQNRVQPRWLHRRRIGLYGLVLAMLASVLVGVSADPAAAHVTYPGVEIVGGGWGHGRGMGQYGALGYARDHGWSSRQILDRFYGNTTQGQAPTVAGLNPDRLHVQLASMNGRAAAVTLSLGRMVLVDAAGNRLRTVSEQAMRLLSSGGGYQVQVSDSCSGPWTDLDSVVGNAIGVKVELDPNDPSDNGEVIGEDSDTLLGICGPVRAWYDGEIWAHKTSSGARTVNVVTVEQYLRGVVPNEVPASWPSAVLEAQAVAARSYVLAGDGRWGGHADTCDNTYCQVYDGRATTRGGTRSATHSRTDAAIAATTGQVRLTSSGRVARTEFSSSTGGHTAGGDFPAVPDLGDATSANPNASWSTTVGLTGLADRYGLGPVTSIEVTERDGHGRFGGRAQEVTIRFRDGTRTMTGSAVRRYFGLKSDLFEFGSVRFGPSDEPSESETPPSPAPVADAEPPEEQATAPEIDLSSYEAVIELMFHRLADSEPTVEQLTIWSAAMAAEESTARLDLAHELVTDEAFAGRLIDDLYHSTFGRPPDSQGRSYWTERLTRGDRSRLTYEEIGTFFFGSGEYYRRSGGDDAAFVKRLYVDLLGRRADGPGLDYWLSVLEDGSTGDVVMWFYRSAESRRDRAAVLYRLVTGERPSSSQAVDGAELLEHQSDLDLAAQYGSELTP